MAASEDGPIMSPWICRAAFQRSVGRLFYHAGFEDFHPSALEAMTDVASSFLTTMATSLTTYMQAPQTKLATGKFTAEEQVLHCLHENGIDLDTLETYVTEDVERLGSKLTQVHDRLRSHLADLLVSIAYRLIMTSTLTVTAPGSWRRCWRRWRGCFQ